MSHVTQLSITAFFCPNQSTLFKFLSHRSSENKSLTEWLFTAISFSRHRKFKLFSTITVPAIHMTLFLLALTSGVANDALNSCAKVVVWEEVCKMVSGIGRMPKPPLQIKTQLLSDICPYQMFPIFFSHIYSLVRSL